MSYYIISKDVKKYAGILTEREESAVQNKIVYSSRSNIF